MRPTAKILEAVYRLTQIGIVGNFRPNADRIAWQVRMRPDRLPINSNRNCWKREETVQTIDKEIETSLPINSNRNCWKPLSTMKTSKPFPPLVYRLTQIGIVGNMFRA